MSYKRVYGTIKDFTVAIIIIFTILSGFKCFEHWFEYTITNEMFIVGQRVLKSYSNNSFVFILLLSIFDIFLRPSYAFVMDIVRIFLSMIRVIVTLGMPIIKEVYVLTGNTLGGLGKDVFIVTPVGYVALVLSGVILILDIVAALLKRRIRNSGFI